MTVQSDATGQLGALPFGNIIGGPLVAAVEAQAKAASPQLILSNQSLMYPFLRPMGQQRKVRQGNFRESISYIRAAIKMLH